jgi:hypothetical protein
MTTGIGPVRHPKTIGAARIRRVRDFALVVLAVTVLLARPAISAAAESKWYAPFWPLGQKVPVVKLSDKYIPFEGKAAIPPRPELLIEAGDAFLDSGKLFKGFEVPILGAVWQPRLWSYFIYRSALQSFDNGTPGRERETEWANRLDFFANLQLTGTEKILLGLRPVDENRPGAFTRYSFDGANDGFKNELNTEIETLFFEGDLGSLLPNLDRAGVTPLDFGFTVGRQPFTFQEGILLNDTLDAVGLVRNNIVFPGTSNLRISALYSWNRSNRSDDARDTDENVYGVFVAADTHVSTYNLDVVYVDENSEAGDGLYFGVSSIQRLKDFGGISTAFRANTSIALEDNLPGDNTVGSGTLLSAEISAIPHGSEDIAYFNAFAAIGNYTQAGREPILGGPLGALGILFASPNLSVYGAEINPFTEEVVGFAMGYQAFWDHKRRNLVLEVAGKHDYDGRGFSSIGTGFQLQQAVGRYVQLTLEGFYVINAERDDGIGTRAEMQLVF